MENQQSNKQLGARYYQALSNLALRSKDERSVAIQLQYLLDEFSKVGETEEEQQKYDEKYNAILAVLQEYTQIEMRMFMLSGNLAWRFKSFAIPTEVCDKIYKIYRKVQAENIGFVNASEFRKEQIARRKQINADLDKML